MEWEACRCLGTLASGSGNWNEHHHFSFSLLSSVSAMATMEEFFRNSFFGGVGSGLTD